jgi:hypothetical protein
MRQSHSLQDQWNTYHFSVGGCIAGAIYAFLMCELLGLVAIATLSLVFSGIIVGGVLGAAIAGGVAAARNYFTDHLISH